jgi:hypothetical protein
MGGHQTVLVQEKDSVHLKMETAPDPSAIIAADANSATAATTSVPTARRRRQPISQLTRPDRASIGLQVLPT